MPYCGKAFFVLPIITASGRFCTSASLIHSPVSMLLASPGCRSTGSASGSALISATTLELSDTVVSFFPQPVKNDQIMYEAPVEGGETRLMGIFGDYSSVEKIESIRSCRLYYIDWALEFDAFYAHCGQAYLAKGMLDSGVI